MRILHLLPHLSGGGAERQFTYLAPELVRRGHRVDVAYLSSGPVKIEINGVALHRLSLRSNYDTYLLWQLFRLIRQIKPDIIHTWILQMDILGGIAARLYGIPWLLREPSSAMAYLPTWKQRLRVLIASGTSAIVSNSAGGDEYWKAQNPASHRYIVANGLAIEDIDQTVAADPPCFLPSSFPIVLYVGRLIVSKNLTVFLEALAHVKQQKNILGILCGEGPQKSELAALRHQLELDEDVHFAGYLPATVLWALMKKASVFVSLSAYEGCPNTVMEAMACGCPLVLSDIPAHREILDENSALFVDPTNIQQTADSILQALNDTEAAKNRVLMAKQRTCEWSIATMAHHYEKIYDEVIYRFNQSLASGVGS